MENLHSDSEPTTEVVSTAYKSNFWKFFFSFLLIITTAVGAYLVWVVPVDSDVVGQDAVVTDNSFFSSMGSNTKEALTRVFSGDAGERLVEIVDVKTGERAVGDVSQEAGALGLREGEGVTMEEVDLQNDGEEAGRSNPPPPEVSEPAGPIDINTVGYDELQRITGVGPAIAGRIIDYRDANDPFYTIEEIQNVSGIGQATFEKMKNEITVGNIEAPPPEESGFVLPPPEESSEDEPALLIEEEPSEPPDTDTSGKININTAGFEELQGITGIGPAYAQRIIDYRDANGPFYTIEEIQNVSGISQATFEKMKNEITVGDIEASPPEESGFVLPPPEDDEEEALPPPDTDTSGKININTAGFEELQGITGIGPAYAQRIIDYRDANGPFYTIEDIKNVKGIGDVTFEKMKDQITI